MSVTDLSARAAAYTTEIGLTPAVEPPEWHNVRAPDARTTLTAAVETPAGRREWRAFLRNPNAVLGLVFLAVIALVSLTAPLLFPGDPLAMVAKPFLWPGQDPAYPLGSDSLGRDVLAGIAHGARISLFVGLAATALGLTAGITVGALAGFFGGRTDTVLMRIVEIFQTLPNFVLLVVLVAILQPSAGTITIAIAVVIWPTIARLTRAEFRSIRDRDYVMAARSLGFGNGRIIFREVLPNALPPLIVTTSVLVATAILMESALSFMGLGDPNVVSWGSMIGTGREHIRTAWYLTLLPGLAIVFTVLAINMIGDGLNDALNPRFTEERT